MWVIFGAGEFDWPSFLSALATLTIVAWAARNSGSLFRTFFLLLGASLAFDTLVEATYPHDTLVVAGVQLNLLVGGMQLWKLARIAGLFFWMCAWGLLALDLFRNNRASPVVHTVSLLPLLVLITAYVGFYLEQPFDIETPDHRVHLVLAGFNLLGILVCLLCVSLGVGKPFVPDDRRLRNPCVERLCVSQSGTSGPGGAGRLDGSRLGPRQVRNAGRSFDPASIGIGPEERCA